MANLPTRKEIQQLMAYLTNPVIVPTNRGLTVTEERLVTALALQTALLLQIKEKINS